MSNQAHTAGVAASRDNLAEVKERLRASWNYQDVLAVAMAKAPSTRFTTDPQRWHGSMAEFQGYVQEKSPELLDQAAKLLGGIAFDRRNPAIPYSDQIAYFLQSMTRSNILITVPSNSHTVYRMNEDAKKDIVATQPPDFRTQDQYQIVIDTLASYMDSHLRE